MKKTKAFMIYVNKFSDYDNLLKWYGIIMNKYVICSSKEIYLHRY